ncbi:MAG TPA: hypothetical protein VGG27_01435 [Magnetospirillaceae bacterium]|jgi:hypothetical protein
MKGPVLIALGLAAAGLGGCSSTPPFDPQKYALEMQQKQQEAQVQAAKDVVEQAPSWYASPPSDSSYMFGAGTATSGDLQFAIDKAALNAKRALADQVHGKLSADMKDYLEETGGSLQPVAAVHGERTTRDMISDVDLQGYEVTQRKVVASGTGYRAFVLMRIPLTAMSHTVAAVDIKPQDDGAATKLRATKAFSDLEKEINDAQSPGEHAAAPVPASAPSLQPPAPMAAPRPQVEETAEPEN